MRKFFRILELFDKDKLDKAENEELKFLFNDPDAKENYTFYKQMDQSLSKSHISPELMFDYILHQSGKSVEDNSSIIKFPDVLNHIRECQKCSEDFKFMNEEYISVNNYLNKNIIKGFAEKQSLFKNIFFTTSFPTLRILSISIIAVGMLYLSLLLTSEFSVSGYKKLALLNDRVENYITRGRVSDDFQKSLISLENKNYKSTIDYLKRDILNNKNDETIFYSYYILGLVYLEYAQTDFLGLFPSFNETDVKAGVKYLKESIYKNNSGQFKSLQYDSYFYLGKAYLMIENKTEAKKYFNLVISYKGSKLEEAGAILNSME